MFPRITKEFIRTNNFQADGINFSQDSEEKIFRLNSTIKLPPSASEQAINLRKKLAAIYATKYESYAQLEVRCYINESLMRKYLSGKRNVTREALAKFCVGTKLSLEQSAELFTLQGHSLEPKNLRFDAVIVNALQDGDDIENFFDTCEEVGIEIS